MINMHTYLYHLRHLETQAKVAATLMTMAPTASERMYQPVVDYVNFYNLQKEDEAPPVNTQEQQYAEAGQIAQALYNAGQRDTPNFTPAEVEHLLTQKNAIPTPELIAEREAAAKRFLEVFGDK